MTFPPGGTLSQLARTPSMKNARTSGSARFSLLDRGAGMVVQDVAVVHRFEQLGDARLVELLSQIADVDAHDVGCLGRPAIPDRAGDRVARQHDARVAHEVRE